MYHIDATPHWSIFKRKQVPLIPELKNTTNDEETWDRIIDKCITIIAMHKNNNITIKQEPKVVSARPALPNLNMELDSTLSSEDAPKDEDIATCEVIPYLLICMID